MATGSLVEDKVESPGDAAAIAAANATGDPDGETVAEEAARRGLDIETIAEERAAAGATPVPTPPTQLAIEGTRDKIPRSTGGRAPERSELRLMGGRRPINGAFDKGSKVTLIVQTIVRAIEDIDIDDEWGTVSETIRVHKARQTFIRIADGEALGRAMLDIMSKAEAKAILDELAG